MKKLYYTIFLLCSMMAGNLTHAAPNAHAPIGVMGDHVHPAGEWMLSYRYMVMDMDGNRTGKDRVSPAEVLKDFRVTPVDMRMTMHMFGAMIAPADWVTLMVMVPYLDNEMDHLTRMGGSFKTESSGIGDTKATALIPVWESEHHLVHINAGVSLPTGSIDEKDTTPMGKVVLPYPMQLGSGTFDLLPGVTYNGFQDAWSWGTQMKGTVRLGENDENYTLGNRFYTAAWGGVNLSEWISVSLRVDYEDWGNIDGADSRLMPTLIPTANPDLRGGRRADVGIGANILIPDGPLAGHRLAAEFELPFYQDLNGPQLETDWILTLGWQKAW